MISWFIDQIPLWVYLVIALTVTGVLFYFFSPILVPLWNATPRWVKVALAFVGAIFSAFVLGRNKAARDAKELQRKRDAQALQKRTEIDHEVGNLSKKDTHERLSRWNRRDD